MSLVPKRKRKLDSTVLLQHLYAGVLDSNVWNQAFVEIADICRGSGTHMFALNPSARTVLRDEGHRMNPDDVKAYQQYWCSRDVLVAPAALLQVNTPTPEHVVLDGNEFHRSEIYNDFMLPQDSPHLLMTWLHKAPNLMLALSIKGTRRRGPFDRDAVAALRPLLPHIHQAIVLRSQMERLNIHNQALRDALSHRDTPILFLDETGRVIEANEAALDVCRSSGVIQIRADGRLWLRGAAGSTLQEWIQLGLSGTCQSSAQLQVQRVARRPLIVAVAPITSDQVPWLGGAPRWTVAITDPERTLEFSREGVQGVFGLTDREAEIVEFLVRGLSVGGTALRLRISINSVKTHLKSVFRKTDTHTQASLVAMALGVSSQVFIADRTAVSGKSPKSTSIGSLLGAPKSRPVS